MYLQQNIAEPTHTGVAVGTAVTSSLLYFDDTFDLSNCIKDYTRSHENAIIFGRMKKIPGYLDTTILYKMEDESSG